MDNKTSLSSGHKKVAILIGIAVILGALGVAKGVLLNKPKETPREITQKIVEYMQKTDSSEADREAIRKYFSKDLVDRLAISSGSSTEASSSDQSASRPVITIQNIDESGVSATATLKISVWIVEVPFQIKYNKDGNYWRGYRWVVSDLITPGDTSGSEAKQESSAKAGEKMILGGGFFLTVSNPTDYTPSNSYERATDGMRYVAVEMEYFNDSESSGEVEATNLKLRDGEGHSYESTYKSEKEPKINRYGVVVTPRSTAKGFLTFEVPKDAKITSGVYSNASVNVAVSFK